MKNMEGVHEALVDRVLKLIYGGDPDDFVSISKHVEFRRCGDNGEIDVLVRVDNKFYGFDIKSNPVSRKKKRIKVQARRFYQYFGYNSRFNIVYPVNNVLTFRTIPPWGGFYNDEQRG